VPNPTSEASQASDVGDDQGADLPRIWLSCWLHKAYEIRREKLEPALLAKKKLVLRRLRKNGK